MGTDHARVKACELLSDSDFFFSYSTVPDTVSLKHVPKWSVYIANRNLFNPYKYHSLECSLEEISMIVGLNFQLPNNQLQPLLYTVHCKEEIMTGY